MTLPDELDITRIFDSSFAADERVSNLIDAIDAASDQDHTTWLVVDGKRVARIAPVDEIPDVFLTPVAAENREDVLDKFYRRLRGEQS